MRKIIILLMMIFIISGCSNGAKDSETIKDEKIEESSSDTNPENELDLIGEEVEGESIEVSVEEEVQEVEAEQVEDNTPISYLADTANDYTREYSDGGMTTITYVGEYGDEIKWDLWTDKDNEGDQVIFTEDEAGLYTGFPESEYYVDIEYPLEEGKIYGDHDNVYDPEIYTITKIDATVTTAAGTFERVVEIKSSDGWVTYYAPNVGHIKSVDENGVVSSELIQITPR